MLKFMSIRTVLDKITSKYGSEDVKKIGEGINSFNCECETYDWSSFVL